MNQITEARRSNFESQDWTVGLKVPVRADSSAGFKVRAQTRNYLSNLRSMNSAAISVWSCSLEQERAYTSASGS
jgi:hypothetical protein